MKTLSYYNGIYTVRITAPNVEAQGKVFQVIKVHKHSSWEPYTDLEMARQFQINGNQITLDAKIKIEYAGMLRAPKRMDRNAVFLHCEE